MKYLQQETALSLASRLPHGRRGLKFAVVDIQLRSGQSPPAWEAGIEIIEDFIEWCEMVASPPAWEAGIEIGTLGSGRFIQSVASRMGGGD